MINASEIDGYSGDLVGFLPGFACEQCGGFSGGGTSGWEITPWGDEPFGDSTVASTLQGLYTTAVVVHGIAVLLACAGCCQSQVGFVGMAANTLAGVFYLATASYFFGLTGYQPVCVSFGGYGGGTASMCDSNVTYDISAYLLWLVWIFCWGCAICHGLGAYWSTKTKEGRQEGAAVILNEGNAANTIGPASSFCMHCGRGVPEVAHFCPHCGNKLWPDSA